MDQRKNLQFCFKLGKSAKETHGLLREVYGDDAMSLKCVYGWFKRFREGRVSIEDDPRSGRPATARTGEKIEKLRNLLISDRRLTVRLLADEVGINSETVRRIVTEDLGKRKLFCRIVPHRLTEEQQQMRLEACGDLIDTAGRNPNFLKSIITGDESWCLKYDPKGNNARARGRRLRLRGLL